MNETLRKNQKLLTVALIALLSTAFGLSYFMRMHQSSTEIVSLKQELPDPDKKYPLDSGLADRISKSYGLALVLVISEYSQRNAVALDGIRTWAKQQYLKDAAFLHSEPIETAQVRHVSIIESLCYSLFSAPRNGLKDLSLDFVKNQVAKFHNTAAYLSFRDNYFDSFGLDREAALLLARYQSDKAKTTVNILLSCMFWSSLFCLCAAYTWRTKYGARSTRTQRLLAYYWIVLGAYYLNVAWSQNQVVLLVSAVVCGGAGQYLLHPFWVDSTDGKGISFRLIELNRPVIICCVWITISLVAIQIMTWIKTGTLVDPDPLSLFLCSWTGNFLHDPASGKRSISHAVGIFWILSSLWAFREMIFGSQSREIDEELALLNQTTPVSAAASAPAATSK